VPDRQAFITGVLFARHLATGVDYISAWNKAKPGQKHPYILIEARGAMTHQDRGRYVPPDGPPLEKLRQSIEELERIVYGSPRLGLPPLREMTNSLQKELLDIKTKLDRLQVDVQLIREGQRERTRLFYAMLVVIFALLISVAFLVFRGT
jgi:hypothetical protein